MTNAEMKYENEIKRMQEAIAKTKSDYLKNDYTKAIKKMRAELQEYRRYMYG